ncbi:hypothetical protein J5N97_016812 [Dioscorea zingiberensis]|uniref:mRNA (guanine-N(7))-methyltransferase n=1 Tax=Dioscorea zingiberensis TaxID=325984 RepID=A0A9D5CLT8_9LILI|nr:hypothetical protein J5N97_016812 [Dioscorea zingiberensis]
MKRGHEEIASGSFTPPAKVKSVSYDDSFKNAQRVADHYSARSNQTLEEREASPIIHLKKLNNWIKSVLIQLYAQKGDAVLDFACGKGGDLIKWEKAQIGYYVGVDIAEGSFSFPARLICADCYEARLDEYLEEDGPYDICSCQVSCVARRALSNISALLRPGGIFIGTMPDANVIIKKLREADGLSFGNNVYWICFDDEFSQKRFRSSSPFGIRYQFHLEDAVDCPEWIVPFPVFKSLAEEYDLELVFVKNSHEFVNEYLRKTSVHRELMRRLGALVMGTKIKAHCHRRNGMLLTCTWLMC